MFDNRKGDPENEASEKVNRKRAKRSGDHEIRLSSQNGCFPAFRLSTVENFGDYVDKFPEVWEIKGKRGGF